MAWDCGVSVAAFLDVLMWMDALTAERILVSESGCVVVYDSGGEGRGVFGVEDDFVDGLLESI